MMYKIRWTEYSKKDYDNLDGSQKILIDKAVNRLAVRGMIEGEIEIIEIVAIGQRDKKEVYKSALVRIKNEGQIDTYNNTSNS